MSVISKQNPIGKIFNLSATNNFRPLRFYFLLFTFYFLLSTFYFLLSASTAIAQDTPQDIAPPPLKIISKAEKSSLEAEPDIKKRTKLALELMEARLSKAEDFDSKEQYEEMFTELGGFHALMDGTLDFLTRKNNDSGKILNNFKRIEISLRKYLTRLELIRRDLPLRYEFYVRTLAKSVRDARTRAVEPLFTDSVIPERKPI